MRLICKHTRVCVYMHMYMRMFVYLAKVWLVRLRLGNTATLSKSMLQKQEASNVGQLATRVLTAAMHSYIYVHTCINTVCILQDGYGMSYADTGASSEDGIMTTRGTSRTVTSKRRCGQIHISPKSTPNDFLDTDQYHVEVHLGYLML